MDVAPLKLLTIGAPGVRFLHFHVRMDVAPLKRRLVNLREIIAQERKSIILVQINTMQMAFHHLFNGIDIV